MGTTTDDRPDDPNLGDIGIRRVDHVGIAVADLDAALDFYSSTFGLRCTHRETNAEQGVEEAMLAVGDGPTTLQLLAPAGPGSTIARFLDRRGPGIQQLAYTVDDVEEAGRRLRERGLRLVYDTPRNGTAGSRVNFVHPADAGGVLVELVEASPPPE
jgi:methylmalonyl-CoA/ethylmalonyl-CoA epimerase